MPHTAPGCASYASQCNTVAVQHSCYATQPSTCGSPIQLDMANVQEVPPMDGSANPSPVLNKIQLAVSMQHSRPFPVRGAPIKLRRGDFSSLTSIEGSAQQIGSASLLMMSGAGVAVNIEKSSCYSRVFHSGLRGGCALLCNLRETAVLMTVSSLGRQVCHPADRNGL